MKKLNDNGMSKSMSVAEVLASRGAVLHSGFMDEIDAEAERAANAIGRAKGMAPAKLGRRRSGFGRPQYSPNASQQNLAMVG